VVQLAQDPKARIEQLAAIIATDPALAAGVMRIANSAAFGRARQVSELETAVVLIAWQKSSAWPRPWRCSQPFAASTS
jgi:HD-like signal output (HDOD) protein